MTQISDIKYTISDLEAKSVTTLADRPAISAADLKFRLDGNDIRTRINLLADAIEELQAGEGEPQ